MKNIPEKYSMTSISNISIFKNGDTSTHSGLEISRDVIHLQLADLVLGWTGLPLDQGFPFKELDLNPAAIYTKKLGRLSDSVHVGGQFAKKNGRKDSCNWIIRLSIQFYGDDPIGCYGDRIGSIGIGSLQASQLSWKFRD